jgi:hypothetical protein
MLEMVNLLESECDSQQCSGIVLTGLDLSSGVAHILKAFVDLSLNDVINKIKGVGDVKTAFETVRFQVPL